MNEMEEFLNLKAVVKIRKNIEDDLLKFVDLMKSFGFLNKYIEYFEEKTCYDEKFNEFCESKFWHCVELNNDDENDICLEFQWGKGFTFGNEKDYLKYNNDIKIITIDELIKACYKEELFNMNYEDTEFKYEISDNRIARELDEFLSIYDWKIVKYSSEKYNIVDLELNTFCFEENVSLNDIIKRVYFRMIDYFKEDVYIDECILEGKFDYVANKYKKYADIGKELSLLTESNIEENEKWFEKIKEEFKKENEKNEIEI